MQHLESAAEPENKIEAYIATKKDRHGERRPPAKRGPLPRGATRVERMKRKLGTRAGAKVYAQRKAIVEPVFGQIKQGRGMRGFLFRRGGEGARRMGVAMPDAQHFEDAHPLPWIATRTGRPKSSSKLPRGAEDRRCTVFAFASPLRPPAPCRCRTSRSPARISIHRKYRAKRILGRPPRIAKLLNDLGEIYSVQRESAQAGADLPSRLSDLGQGRIERRPGDGDDLL